MNLLRIETGSSDIFTNPILNDMSADDVLSGWDNIFRSSEKINKPLMELETSNRSKFGPRSIAIPWMERKESVESYFGLSSLGDDLSAPVPILNRLRPLDIGTASLYLKNNSNSGLPFYMKKKNVKSTVLSEDVFRKLIARRDPCVLFTRTQENKKTRTVWGYPIADTLREMQFYRPILDIQKRLGWRAALSTPEVVDRGVTDIINTALKQNLEILSIDFSSYDASVKSGLQKSAWSYIKQMYQSKYHAEIDDIADRFLRIGLITPDGIMSGPHGVPSGSTFTNEIDSIVQYLVAYRCRDILHIDKCQIQGDDGLYIVSDPVRVSEHFKNYGLSVNMDKSIVAKDHAIYLQSLFHNDYRDSTGLISGIYPTYRALTRIMFLERFEDFEKDDISGKDYFAIRTISILENCKHHPLFRELVLYVLSLDKYKLQVSEQGLLNYVKRLNDQEGKDVSFKEWSYGEDVRGIKAFETYKIINEVT